MKKIAKKSIGMLIALSMLILGSCHDFLDVTPKGIDTARTIAHFEGLTASTVVVNMGALRANPQGGTAVVPGVSHNWVFMTDELIADPTTKMAMTRTEQNAFRWEADIFETDDFSIEWNTMYQQIYIWNVVVNGVMDAIDGTPEEKRRILAEARVGRAWNYMMLAQFFCRPYNPATAAADPCVPIVLEASTGQSGFRRASVQDVYDFIISELEEAVPDLGLYTLHRQKIFRFAGYNILGRALMLVHDYEGAVRAFTEAEALKNRATINVSLFNYRVMMPIWTASPLWAMGMAYPGAWVAGNTELVLNRQIPSNPIGGGPTAVPKALVKPEFMEMFKPGDLRRLIFDNEGLSNYRRRARVAHNEGVDMPMFYLNYAETLARTGHLPKAREIITYFREHRFEEGYADIPADVVSQDDLIVFIVQERLLEYMATGHRWFDMRRLWHDPLFQHLKENYTHTDGVSTWELTEDRLVFRIPPSIMIHNPGWTNNP